MKSNLSIGLMGLMLAGSASAQGLYYVGNEAQESIPLKWVVGTSLTYDDNVSPGNGPEQDSLAVNPYVGLSFVNMTPQTTWDVYTRLGMVYYFDAPAGMDDISPQNRLGFNVTHRFSERLRFSSRNFVSYELEPDYSYGYASSRQSQSYFFWQTDNSLGYRWTERMATYSGFTLTGANYDAVNNDRLTGTLYHQFRYQLTPQSVATLDYRYSETLGDGLASDATDHYILAGLEHRFSPNMIGIFRGGLQLHDVDAGTSTSSPYMELAFNSRLTQEFTVRAFTRYGIENYDTVRNVPVVGAAEFSDRSTLRLGISSEYAISPSLSLFGGVDYIPSDFQDGQAVGLIKGPVGDYSEDLINAYIGLSMKFTEILSGSLTYNYTNQDSDFLGQTYNRNRISIGLSAEF